MTIVIYLGNFWALRIQNAISAGRPFQSRDGSQLSNYDLLHVCLYIHKFQSDSKMEVMPSTDEKYITLTIGVPVRTFQDKNGLTKTVFEYLRFFDSFRFMASSLEKLARYLPKENFKILDSIRCGEVPANSIASRKKWRFDLIRSCFADYSEPDRDLLYQMGYYPHSYFDDFTNFREEKLSSRNKWKDSFRNCNNADRRGMESRSDSL